MPILWNSGKIQGECNRYPWPNNLMLGIIARHDPTFAVLLAPIFFFWYIPISSNFKFYQESLRSEPKRCLCFGLFTWLKIPFQCSVFWHSFDACREVQPPDRNFRPVHFTYIYWKYQIQIGYYVAIPAFFCSPECCWKETVGPTKQLIWSMPLFTVFWYSQKEKTATGTLTVM